jgi:hypothetical protein
MALARWIKKHGNGGSSSYEDGKGEQAFLAWLRTVGYVVDDKLNEVHLCDYSWPDLDAAKDKGDEPAEL